MRPTEDTYRHKGLRKKLTDVVRNKGITDEKILDAVNKIPRHFFLDSAFDDVAYEDRAFPIGEGQTIYLKPKKRNGTAAYCIVKDGQSLHDIAQENGIKLRLLKKWNQLDDQAQAQPGQKLLLKKS